MAKDREKPKGEEKPREEQARKEEDSQREQGLLAGEENVMTPEEFERLEKKWGRKKGLGTKGKTEEEASIAEEREPAIKVEKLLMEIEKVNARLEMIDRFRKDVDEKTMSLAEEIGELRSNILDREKTFRQMEIDFKSMEDMIEEVEPKKTMNQLRKMHVFLEENSAKIEMNRTKIAHHAEEVKKLRDLMNKIKSFENLVDISKDIEKKISEMREKESYTRRTAAKVEKIFGEIETKLLELDKQKERIDRLNELIEEFMGSLDTLELKSKKMVTTEDFNKLQAAINESRLKLKEEFDSRMEELRNIIDMLISIVEEKSKTKSKKLLESMERLKEMKREKREGPVPETLRTEEEKPSEKPGIKIPVSKLGSIARRIGIGKSRVEERLEEKEMMKKILGEEKEGEGETPGWLLPEEKPEEVAPEKEEEKVETEKPGRGGKKAGKETPKGKKVKMGYIEKKANVLINAYKSLKKARMEIKRKKLNRKLRLLRSAYRERLIKRTAYVKDRKRIEAWIKKIKKRIGEVKKV